MAIPSDTPARQRREMKRHTHTSTSVGPRRLLLQERAPTAANNTTAPATNSTSSSSKATAIPPQPPKSRYYPSDMPPPDTSGSTETVHFDSSSVAVTALVILSALFFLGFFSVYARRYFAPDWDNPDPSTSRRRRRLTRRGRMAVTSPGRAPRGLDPDAIKALPLVRYSAPDDQKKSQDGKARGAVAAASAATEDEHRCCAVCLGEFEDGEELRAIPGCGHAFHRECIDAWLSARGSCPLCRSTDLLGGAGKNGAPGSRCEACRLESVVVVPSAEEAAAASVAGQGNGGGGQQRRSEGGNGQLQHQAEAAPSAAAPMASPEARGLGGVGRSRSWLCMSAAAADEKADDEKGPPAAEVAREEQPPRRSCS